MKKADYIDIKRVLRVSTVEGIFAQIFTTMSGVGSVFVTKMAVMLGATAMQFGILSAIGQFSQIFQPIGWILTRRRAERKQITVIFAAIGRGMAFIFGLLPFIMGWDRAMWIFLLLFTVSVSLEAISGNAWIAWISDLIPTRFRGRFFSVRNQYLMIAGVITGYIVGFVVDLFDKNPGSLAKMLLDKPGLAEVFNPSGQPMLFLGIFSLATIIGSIVLVLLTRQPERPKPVESTPVARMLLEPFRDKNFRRLVIFGFWWMLATGIGAPFWQPFMIKKLGMSVLSIQVYGTISTVFSLLALKPWGKIIDHFGNKNAMRIGIILGGLNPLLWLFVSPENYWLLYVEAATSGIMWSGVGIVMINFVLSISGKEKRQVYSGINGAVNGVGMMLTMLLSGALIPKTGSIGGFDMEPEQVLFLITGLARWTALIPLIWIDESRAKGVGDMIVSMSRYAKVRLARMAWWKPVGKM